MNVSSGSPRVFVLWRMDGELGDENARAAAAGHRELRRGRPLAGRRPLGGQRDDAADAIFAWVGDYVEKNYRPEPKKRIKPRSFIHPKDRIGR